MCQGLFSEANLSTFGAVVSISGFDTHTVLVSRIHSVLSFKQHEPESCWTGKQSCLKCNQA